MSPKIYFSLAFRQLACAFLAVATVASMAQGNEAPQAVHVICVAEDAEAFHDVLSIRDMEGMDDLGLYFDLKTGQVKNQHKQRFDELLRKHVWQLQGLHARSLGTGFVVSDDRKQVLTSYDIAAACPLVSNAPRGKRQQIAVLSGDGLRGIKGYALGINQFTDSTGQPAPLPRFICKRRESDCSRFQPDDLKKLSLQGGAKLAKLFEEVKYWVPDLVLINLEEAADAKPVVFRAPGALPSGATLRYAGFPRASQHGGMGVSNTVVAIERAKPTVQPAIFSREITIDSAAEQIVLPNMRVKGSWLEISGASIERGNSGAPLYDPDSGQIVGMVINDLQNDGTQGGGKAIPVNQMIDYLKAASASFNPPVQPPSPVANPAPIPASMPSAPKVEVTKLGSIRDMLMSPKALIIAALLTVFVALVGFFLVRQKSDAAPVVQDGSNSDAYKPAPTKNVYFATLRSASGPLAAREFTLPTPSGKDSLTVGKDPSVCQVIFPDKSDEISGLHCRFHYDTAQRALYVEDLQSTNGTFVNKRPLKSGERVRLQSNDVVSLSRPDTNAFVVGL